MDVVAVLLLIVLANWLFITYITNRFLMNKTAYLWWLFAIHSLMTAAYMIYVAYSASDSVAYYNKTSNDENWFALWESGTTFIHFVAWPFIHFADLSYYATMLCFSFMGYVGIVLFYIATSENIQLPTVWNKLSLVEIVYLLPNLHFWSASLGKGSVILAGLSLCTFGLSRFDRRPFLLLLGAIIVYMVRPHILFTLLLSIMVGVLITSGGISFYLRMLVFFIAAIAFWYINDTVLQFADMDSLNVFNADSLNHRAQELGKASSGVNISEYNLFAKLFTFWFRPLFVDSGGIVGVFASVENVLYVGMFLFIIKQMWVAASVINGWFKILLIFFLLGSFILAQVSGNLGIAMRQKAQMMPFFFIIFCKMATYLPSSSTRN